MREVERNIKKKYYRPEIISVGIDVSLNNTEMNSPGSTPPTEPGEGGDLDVPASGFGASSYNGNSKYVFPDSPASDNPFGGSTPNYR